jgi:predicted nuclease of restriction endonuclease-like (RecB) superfamily
MSSEIVQYEQAFSEILALIHDGKRQLFKQANTSLIQTYWNVGGYLSRKVSQDSWGKGVVFNLAQWLANKGEDSKGFSQSNLWRMKQFYELYAEDAKLAPLVRELPWTHNLIIMARCKSPEERFFYLKSCAYANWSKRVLEDQIASASFERTALADIKLAPAVREFPVDVTGIFKDSYLIDFAKLPDQHLEKDLQAVLVAHLRKFLLELGDGFTFIGEKIRVQVGNKDFELDLLFYHRDLQCMVAFELKTGDFEPSHLGQLSFYLEALDRQRKRPHENPTIGVLLCKSKDDEVVEMALSRTLAPAMVSEYQTKMIPKELLKQKLHEWSESLENR